MRGGKGSAVAYGGHVLFLAIGIAERKYGCMARPLRIEYDGAVYRIASRGNERICKGYSLIAPVFRTPNQTRRQRLSVSRRGCAGAGDKETIS
jgi:hypothetical protein